MDTETFASPAAVRTMLSATPCVTTQRPLPRFCGWACGSESAKFAMASNWSSFAGEIVRPEGCEVHTPYPCCDLFRYRCCSPRVYDFRW